MLFENVLKADPWFSFAQHIQSMLNFWIIILVGLQKKADSFLTLQILVGGAEQTCLATLSSAWHKTIWKLHKQAGSFPEYCITHYVSWVEKNLCVLKAMKRHVS